MFLSPAFGGHSDEQNWFEPSLRHDIFMPPVDPVSNFPALDNLNSFPLLSSDTGADDFEDVRPYVQR